MSELSKIQPMLSLVISFATFVGLIIAMYRSYRDPDVSALQEIALIKNSCNFKHKGLDENISLIKNNHLHHIESDIKDLKENQVKIFTILEERLPGNKNAL